MYFAKGADEVATPQNKLVYVEGVPSNIQRDVIKGRYGKQTPVIRFDLGDYCTSYTGSNPNYREVAAAIQSGKPLRVGFGTKLSAKSQFAEMYTLSVNHKQVLQYSDRAEQLKKSHSSLLIVGSVLLGICAFGSFMNLRNSRQYARLIDVTPA